MKIVGVFRGVHMGKGHEGLIQEANSHGVQFKKLAAGCGLLFINRAGTRCKVLHPGGKIVSYLDNGSLISPTQIGQIAVSLGGSPFQYDKWAMKALGDSLKEILKERMTA